MECPKCLEPFSITYQIIQEWDGTLLCLSCSYSRIKKELHECDHEKNRCSRSLEEMIKGTVK